MAVASRVCPTLTEMLLCFLLLQKISIYIYKRKYTVLHIEKILPSNFQSNPLTQIWFFHYVQNSLDLSKFSGSMDQISCNSWLCVCRVNSLNLNIFSLLLKQVFVFFRGIVTWPLQFLVHFFHFCNFSYSVSQASSVSKQVVFQACTMQVGV